MLVAQSVLLAAAGERTPVIIDAITLIVLLARAGLRPAFGQLAAALALTRPARGRGGRRALWSRAVRLHTTVIDIV